AEVAARLPAEARAVGWDEIGDHLAMADLVLSGTGAPGIVLGREEVGEAVSRRPARPLLVVDIAVPRDVDPGVRELQGVTLLDMDDLLAFAEVGISGRQAEVARVRAIVEEETARFSDLSSARTVAPLVAALHEHGESVRAAELARLAARLNDLDEKQRRAVEALSRGIVAKLLHDPTVRLKEEAGTPRGERMADALRTLFGL